MASITQRLFTLGLTLNLALAFGATSTRGMADDFDRIIRPPLRELASLRWQYRVILVDAAIPDAIARLRGAQSAVDERDILWFALDQGQVQTNYSATLDAQFIEELEGRYFSTSEAAVFLIGKDGGLKASADHLDLPALFARIDAMPMRRREMDAAR